ncbi:acetyl-CoA carboxylase [Oryzobacter terrae]|uniref:acetyl-CoA carboxylase n=1 Tax=Oryzobacter terrae TaxID=1620385 RepID=UPI003672F436
MTEHVITSPLPGVFYRSPAPGEPPFVQEGDSVEAGQTVGLVEIMKQFTELKSGVAGVLEGFRVDDLAMVNPGDTVAVVREGES